MIEFLSRRLAAALVTLALATVVALSRVLLLSSLSPDIAAARGVPVSLNDFLAEARVPTAINPLGRVLRGEMVIHVADIREEEAYRAGFPGMLALADLGGCRTALWVALRRATRCLAFSSYTGKRYGRSPASRSS